MALENTNDFIVSRLANFSNTAEGSLLPPPQKGQFRVPFVSSLKVTNTQSAINSTTFTIAWQDIIANTATGQASTVDHYNIYYTLPTDGTGQPIGPFTAKQSPAVVNIPFTQQVPVTFIVQTVLSNGMTSELAFSPTTTGFTSPYLINGDSIFVAGLVTTNNFPGGGQIAWSNCTVYYGGVAYPIVAGNTSAFYLTWTVGAGTFSGVSQTGYTPASNIYMIATNQAGTADIAWNKVAGGAIHGGLINLPQALDGPNGTLTVNVSFTSNSPAGNISWSTGTVNYKGITYNITSGSTSTTFYVFWQLASPTIFQSSATPPALGADDFLVAYNLLSGGVGTYSPVVGIHDSLGNNTNQSSSAFNIYNKNAKFAGSLNLASTSIPATLSLADGTGTGSLGGGQRIIATGSDGKVQMGTFEVNIANSSGGNTFPNFIGSDTTHTAGPLLNWLHIKLNGTDGFIQVFT